jgi:hypothetical protein
MRGSHGFEEVLKRSFLQVSGTEASKTLAKRPFLRDFINSKSKVVSLSPRRRQGGEER